MRDPKWIFKQYGACLCKAGIRKREEIERSIKNYVPNPEAWLENKKKYMEG
jgi:hypothetical protein